jgi:hypothetical protein
VQKVLALIVELVTMTPGCALVKRTFTIMAPNRPVITSMLQQVNMMRVETIHLKHAIISALAWAIMIPSAGFVIAKLNTLGQAVKRRNAPIVMGSFIPVLQATPAMGEDLVTLTLDSVAVLWLRRAAWLVPVRALCVA